MIDSSDEVVDDQVQVVRRQRTALTDALSRASHLGPEHRKYLCYIL